jgi:hypothetical protein
VNRGSCSCRPHLRRSPSSRSSPRARAPNG